MNMLRSLVFLLGRRCLHVSISADGLPAAGTQFIGTESLCPVTNMYV